MAETPSAAGQPSRQQPSRRRFFERASSLAMAAGLVGGYGALAGIAVRFLFPARPGRRQWMYVTETAPMRVGDAVLYRGPSGETINIARQASGGGSEDFIALSSTCPHLGCQVHWEPHNERFFCPCHNGVFDPSGKGLAGPPGDAGLELPRYPLKVERGLLYIELPVETLTSADAGQVIERVDGIHGPGHDPCLVPRPERSRPPRGTA